jgi:hypothetical protein
MVNQPCTATALSCVAPVFRDGMAVAVSARKIGRRPGSVGWPLKETGPKRNNRARSKKHKADDSRHAAPAPSFRKADLAFQQAMRRAVAQGREHPPMIGVFKDARPLRAPRLFEPVPYTSGCTSPALVCGESDSAVDPMFEAAASSSRARSLTFVVGRSAVRAPPRSHAEAASNKEVARCA